MLKKKHQKEANDEWKACFNNAEEANSEFSLLILLRSLNAFAYPNTLFIMNEWIKRWLTELLPHQLLSENVF